MDRIKLITILAVLMSGCGFQFPEFRPLEERLLKVVDVTPQFGEAIGPDGEISVKFSRQVDPMSVSSRSIFVASTADLPADPADIDKDKLSSLNTIPGVYLISDDGRTVEYRPEGGFGSGGEYNIIVTTELSSADGLPLGGGAEMFSSMFYVDVVDNGENSEITGNETGKPGGSAGSGGTNEGNGGSGNIDDTGSGGEGPSFPQPSYLYINEIYYDADGADTNGDVFIELAGEAGGYLEGYYIALINGDDGKTYKTIPITDGNFVGDDGLFVIADTDSEGVTHVADADFLAGFDPQNGPDSIQLISPDGLLVDVVGYGKVPKDKAENGFAMYEVAPAADSPSGKSLSRLEGREDTGDNSADFVINESPSPGAYSGDN